MRAYLRSSGDFAASRYESLKPLLWENTLEPLYQEVRELLSKPPAP